MKQFLLILLISLHFQQISKASDISEFEIEGMSIGDSALNFFSKSEIEKSVKETPQYSKDDYKIVFFAKSKKHNFDNYEGITFYYKKNDKLYKIAGILASNYYPNSFEDCLNDLKIMQQDIENSLNIVPVWNGKQNLGYDTYGNTTMHGSIYNLVKKGDAQIVCYDWSDQITKIQGRIDELTLAISNEEYGNWLLKNSD